MDAEQVLKNKNIINTERYKYPRTATAMPDGKVIHSKDNGDPVALALRGSEPDDLVAFLEENGMLDDRYKAYRESMKPGRFRMTVGQAIRYRWKRGEKTTIRGVVLDPPAPKDIAA
jgi:hypothetical protein